MDIDDEELIRSLVEHEQKQLGYYEYKNETIKTGLENYGNNCYVSAAILSLSNLTSIRELFLELIYKETEAINRNHDVRFVKRLCRVMHGLLLNNAEETEKAYKLFLTYAFANLPKYQAGVQCDANEFLLDLISKTVDQLVIFGTGRESFQWRWENIFGFSVNEHFLCSSTHFDVRTESLSGLNLIVGSFKSLDDCLYHHFKLHPTGQIEILACPVCKSSTSGHRYRNFVRSPSSLIISLNRFSVDSEVNFLNR